MTFKDIAIPLAQRGIPVMPLKSREKAAFLSDWTNKATTDVDQINEWDNQYPNANCASVAKAVLGAVWFLELDSPDAWLRIETDTGNKLPKTFSVRSSPGRGHFYFKHTEASLAMGNIAQGFVKHADWSARANNEYVVSPGSTHPSGRLYEIISNAEIVEAPDWLIDWLLSQKISSPEEKKKQDAELSAVPEGQRNSSLTAYAGKLRYKGLDYHELKTVLLAHNQENCKPPLPDSEVDTIARSVSRYRSGEDDKPLIGGVPVGESLPKAASVILQENVQDAKIRSEQAFLNRKPLPYPKFPEWVMYNTSIYEGLVKPVCDVNSRYPEFMFMPAMTMMLNYLGNRVRIAEKGWPNSLYLLCIGRKGLVIKSSSAEDAIRYFIDAGVAGYSGRNVQTSDGKTMVWQAGSTEGLGKDMQRINCHNAVLYYDEFSALVAKASIESSSMLSHLTSMYESGPFQNQIKQAKDAFDFAPGTYTASLISCTTDKNFHRLWSQMAASTGGLDERFFFLLQPEQLKEPSPQKVVSTTLAAVRTRALIEKAVAQGTFKIFDDSPLAKSTREGMTNRMEIHAEKFALYFAVDLGLDEIDDLCIERGLALANYEKEVKTYLHTNEVYTKEAGVQSEIENFLIRQSGPTEQGELFKQLHAERWGTTLWNQALSGLIKTEAIIATGRGVKGDPRLLTWDRPERLDD